MNLLRNVSELSKSTKLLKSLKRAEGYLFSAKELEGSDSTSNGQTQSPIPSFKSLFQQEAKLLPSYLSKLNVASHHPVMGIARDFYGQNPSMPSLSPSLQLRAIFVLLIAKSISLQRPRTKETLDNSLAVDSKKKALSQITELLFAGHLLHRSIVDITEKRSDLGLQEGNKVATLMGDLLLAKTSRRLSDLKNHTVTEIMSDTISEFSEGGFVGESITPMPAPAAVESKASPSPDSDSDTSSSSSSSSKEEKESRESGIIVPQPVTGARPQLTYENWLARSNHGLGAIVGNSCISCMVLAGEDNSTKEFASELGRRVGILLQAYRDITIFEGEDEMKQEFPEFIDFWTLPVIIAAEQNPGLIPDDITCLDHMAVFEKVQSSLAAMQKSKRVLANFRKEIINSLSNVPPSEAVEIMLEIVAAMEMKTS